jgi:hypothetical protein
VSIGFRFDGGGYKSILPIVQVYMYAHIDVLVRYMCWFDTCVGVLHVLVLHVLVLHVLVLHVLVCYMCWCATCVGVLHVLVCCMSGCALRLVLKIYKRVLRILYKFDQYKRFIA